MTDSQICRPYVYPSGSHTDSSFFSTSSLLSPIDCKELITSSYELGQSLSYQTHRQHTTQLVCVSVARTRNCFHSELVGIESPLFTKVPTRTGHRFLEKQFAKILNPGSNLGHFWRLVQSHGGRHEKKKKTFTWVLLGHLLSLVAPSCWAGASRVGQDSQNRFWSKSGLMKKI